MKKYTVNERINQAETLPADFYRNPDTWETCKEKIFCKNYLYLGDKQSLFSGLENVYPLWLLENYLDEPVLLSKKDDEIQCMTNVCTHRGFLLVQHPFFQLNAWDEHPLDEIICGVEGYKTKAHYYINFKYETKKLDKRRIILKCYLISDS